jgi:DNA-binding transcriptional MerR regulator
MGMTANKVVALTEDHISRITGLSKGQLRAWDRRGFFVPKHAFEDRSSAYSRIYSFKDAVGLRTIARLRAAPYRISLQRLFGVAKELEARGIEHWADVRIHVVKGEVSIQPPASDEVESVESGQYAMLPIIDVIREVSRKIEEIKRRDNTTYGKVDRNKFVARNSWVVSGTRIPTATIRRYVEAGFSKQHILEEYPTLTLDDIDAAIEHEKRLAQSA